MIIPTSTTSINLIPTSTTYLYIPLLPTSIHTSTTDLYIPLNRHTYRYYLY